MRTEPADEDAARTRRNEKRVVRARSKVKRAALPDDKRGARPNDKRTARHNAKRAARTRRNDQRVSRTRPNDEGEMDTGEDEMLLYFNY